MKATAKKPARSWNVRLLDKLNRLSFPSLTQGADKLTEGKRLAGILSILRHNDPDITKSPIGSDGRLNGKGAGKGCTCIMAEAGRRLERAILERDTKFLQDFRRASLKPQSRTRDVYSWLLSHYREVEACPTKLAIWRLVTQHFSRRTFDRGTLYHLLDDVGLPVVKPASKRTPAH